MYLKKVYHFVDYIRFCNGENKLRQGLCKYFTFKLLLRKIVVVIIVFAHCTRLRPWSPKYEQFLADKHK